MKKNSRKIKKKVMIVTLLLMMTSSTFFTLTTINRNNIVSSINTVSTSSLNNELSYIGYKYNISSWWNSSYKYRIGLEVENNEGFDRYQPVDVFLTFRPNEFYEGTGRLVSCNSTGNNYSGYLSWSEPLPVQVWNESKFSGTDYINTCSITFIANVSKNANATYFFYYNNEIGDIIPKTGHDEDYNTGFTNSLWQNKLIVTVDNIESYQVVLDATNSDPKAVSELKIGSTNLHSDSSLAPEKQLTNVELALLTHFDENSGTTLSDSSAAQITGTFSGAPLWTDGIINYALDFDGVDDFVTFPNALQDPGQPFDISSTQWTFTCWINPDLLSSAATNHGTQNVFAAKASDAYNDNFEIGVHYVTATSGNIHVYLDTNNGNTQMDFGPTDAIQTNGGWYFIALVYDGSTGDIKVRIQDQWYSDGSTWGAGHMSNADGSPFSIGCSEHSDRFFNGQIDELAIYSTVLSDEEIETYKYCSASSTIATITEIEVGDVFSSYEVDWNVIFDMHISDICTFYYDYNLWNIERTIYFEDAFDGSDTLAQMTALNTYYDFSSLQDNEDFYYFYDGKSELDGLGYDDFVVENYTIIHDPIHSSKYTLGIFINSYNLTGSDAINSDISYFNGTVTYTDNSVLFTSGSINDFYNNIGGSDNSLTIDYWEFVDKTNITEGYTNDDMIGYFNNVSTSLKSSLKIYIYDQEGLFFNLEVVVKDHDGNIVPYATVHLLNKTTQEELSNQNTDLTGSTKFYRLNNGTYTVNLTYDRYSPNILTSIAENVDVNLTEADTDTFGEKTLIINDVNLTSIEINLVRTVSDVPVENVDGANVTFAIDGSTIGYENTDSDGVAIFHWTNSSGPLGPNVSITAEWHGIPCTPLDHPWDNNSNPAIVEFNFYQYQNLTIEYESDTTFVTRLYVNSTGSDDVMLGETFNIWVNFTQIEIDSGIPQPEVPITDGSVTYNIKIGTLKINTITLSFGEIGSGNYSILINSSNPIQPGGASWESSVTYTMEIIAYKAGYGTNQTSISFSLNDKESILTNLNATPIYTYWLNSFSLDVHYQGTDGLVDLNGAIVNYYVTSVPGLSGSLSPQGNGIYRLTLNTTLFPEPNGREYTIQIVANIKNYASQQVFPSVRIYDILTKINGTESSEILTKEAEIFVGVAKTFYFNYTVALTGSGITSASVEKACKITNQATGDRYQKTLVHVSNGIWSLDIDSELLAPGIYSVQVRIQETNYEECIAIITLTVNKRIFSTSAQNIYSVVSGKTLEVRLKIIDSYDQSEITDIQFGNAYIEFGGHNWILEYQNSGENAGYYTTVIQNIPGNVLILPETQFMTLHIARDNFTTTNISIPISIGLVEIWPGMPLFWFLMVIGAIAAVAGSLGVYRYLQIRNIPKFVKKNKAMRKAINSKSKIGDNMLYPTKSEATVKLLGNKWDDIGLS
ncbi:MAG: hypothetical protein FK734_11560, partial [Asgard group archaeon]|nr:hypothetical protein [Asgard group archaeon]